MDGNNKFQVAKITPPNPPALFHRSELIEVLENQAHLPLVMLIAHPGSGKTMLAAQFVSRLKVPVAWYYLEDSDRDFTQFGGYLVESIKRVEPEFGRSEAGYSFWLEFEQAAGNLGKETLPAALIDRLANAFLHDLELLKQKTGLSQFWLILDDYQFAESPAHNRFLERVVRWLPRDLHVLLVAREIPQNFPFAEFLGRQKAQSIGVRHFKYNLAEVETLLAEFYGYPDREAARYLWKYSEGWAAIIFLTLQSLRFLARSGSEKTSLKEIFESWFASLNEDAASGSNTFNKANPDLAEHPIYNYLAHSLFNQQPTDRQLFLLQTSVLDVLSVQTCEQLLGETGRAKEHLEALLNQSVFLNQLNPEEGLYQYHFLIKAFLVKLLANRPDLWRKTHQQAAEIFSQTNQPLKALTYWLKAGEVSAPVQLLNKLALNLYETGRWKLLQEMLDLLNAVPGAARQVATQADLIHVKGLLTQEAGQLEDARQLLLRAADLYQEQNALDLTAKVKSTAALLLVSLDEFSKAREEASPLLDYRGTSRYATLAVGIAHLTVGWVAQRSGQFEPAEQAFQKAEELFEAIDDKNRANITKLNRAALYLGMGRLIKARSLFQRTLPYWQKTGNPSREVNIFHMLATISRRTGKFEEAIKGFEENLTRLKEIHYDYMEPFTLHELGDCYREIGRYAKARDCYEKAREIATNKNVGLDIQALVSWSLCWWLEAQSPEAMELSHEALELTSLHNLPAKEPDVRHMLGLLALDKGQYKEASKQLQQGLDLMVRFPAPPLQVRSLLLLAATYFKLSKKELALQTLAEGFELCSTLFYEPYLPCELERARAVLNYAASLNSPNPPIAELSEDHIEIIIEFLSRSTISQYLELTIFPELPKEVPAQGDMLLELKKPGLLELRALDGGRVFDYSGDEIMQWAWPKARWLLFYLVENPGVTTEKIQVALWNDEVKSNTVHAMMSSLRKAIPALKLEKQQRTFRLEPGSFHYDVFEFERAIKSLTAQASKASTEKLCQTLSLYKQEFLSNVTTEWAMQRRRHLLDLYIEGQIQLAQIHFEQKNYADAIAASRQVLLHDELYDAAHQLIINSYREAGQELDARRHEALYDKILQKL